MPITDARLLGPKGSQDDLVLDIGEGTSSTRSTAFSLHAQAPPAPHSAPRRLLSSPDQHRSTDPPSPIKSTRTSAAAATDVKGKGKGKAAAAYEPTDSFLKRLAGPSTGKAGLLRDPEEVRQIIWEASKGSKFAENERKRDEATTVQVQKMLNRLESKLKAKKYNLVADEREMELRAQVFEAERHLSDTVVVVDADAFYASVEELLDPSLKGKAFGVGSGVLTTASYEARRFGCRSAMAGFVAKKLCPHLIFVKPKFAEYASASEKIMDILRDYDPQMSPASLDEAYMNITAHLLKTGQTAAEAVSEMRARVKAETGLTVSAGAGVNKTIAKIAADVNKPDGQCIVAPDREAVLAFLHQMPVRKIPGIGRVTERWLDALDVKTVGDIWTHRGKLNVLRDEVHADWLLRKYLGLGSSVVEPGKREDRKSVGCEATFSTIWKEVDLFAQLKHIAESLAGDLERLRFSGRTITLKLKLDTYELLTRAHTSGPSIYHASAEDLYRIGKSLLEKELSVRHKTFDLGQTVQGCKGSRDLRLRLMGLRATNLRDEDASSKGATVKNALSSWIHSAVTATKPEPAVIDLVEDSDEEEEDGEDVALCGAADVEVVVTGATELKSASVATQRTKRPHTTAAGPGRGPEPSERNDKRKKAKGSSSVKLVSDADEALANVSCPMCERLFERVSLSQFNFHLDRCLGPTQSTSSSSTSSSSNNKSKSKSKNQQEPRRRGSNAFEAMMSASSSHQPQRRRDR